MQSIKSASKLDWKITDFLLAFFPNSHKGDELSETFSIEGLQRH